jgi:glutamate dehydrogenase/leucine dehydrogenase
MSQQSAAVAEAPARPAADVWRRYGEYLRRPPQVVVEWNDRETEARGWLVINSLRGGAAGGGTRMRPGLTRQEVTYLAKTMELKFAYSGPDIGGGKSGIDFDPADPRRDGVLHRWFQAVSPYLHRCYGTGGDLNVDEVRDVIPCCREIGLRHPQEGIVVGHWNPEGAARDRILHALDVGVKAPVGGELGIDGLDLPVADLVTGYGLAVSIRRFFEETGGTLHGRRVLVEGFGAVGAPCALYLARWGGKVAAISDREGSLVDEAGLDGPEVEALLRGRGPDKLLPRADRRWTEGHAAFDAARGEVYVAAAASGTLDDAALAGLGRRGVQVIASGANQPFREAHLGTTRVQRGADRAFAVIPDVIANCGMARAFSHLMQDGAPVAAGPIFAAVDDTITRSLREVLERTRGSSHGLLAAAFDLAMDRIAHT